MLGLTINKRLQGLNRLRKIYIESNINCIYRKEWLYQSSQSLEFRGVLGIVPLSGPLGTVPELLFEKKQFVPELQLLLVKGTGWRKQLLHCMFTYTFSPFCLGSCRQEVYWQNYRDISRHVRQGSHQQPSGKPADLPPVPRSTAQNQENYNQPWFAHLPSEYNQMVTCEKEVVEHRASHAASQIAPPVVFLKDRVYQDIVRHKIWPDCSRKPDAPHVGVHIRRHGQHWPEQVE